MNNLHNRDGVTADVSIPLSGQILGVALALLLLRPADVPALAGQPRSRTFELTYKATVRDIPEGTKVLDLWLPLPQTDRNQTIHRITIDAPNRVSIGREVRFGNQSLYVRVDHPEAPVMVTLTVEATRWESAGSDEVLSTEARADYLKPEPLDGPIRALALEAIRDLDTDADKARAIYEKVVGLMKYDKSGTGWGRGDALFACDAKRGNCSDFHALVIGMARSVDIPARFAIGLPLPDERGTGDIAGYHCWAELYVRGRGWVPVDASEAAKDPTRRGYFFGHHDEDRLEFSRGRHLTLTPAQQGPPLNFFVYPYAELDGRPHEAIDRKFTVGVARAPWSPQASGTKARLRGLSVVDSKVVWASGSHGTFVMTTDSGATWRPRTVPDASGLDFRDIHAVDRRTAYLLSVGEGDRSRIFKTTDGGDSWSLQFVNRDPKGFLDAFAFWDVDRGIALGDPVDGRFAILATDDGGRNWERNPVECMPPALPGEGAFAASGTCLVVQGQRNAWFGTGGPRASRIFRSIDRGHTWTVHETPIRVGNASSGIFSLSFRDPDHGVAVGGDYKQPEKADRIIARTADGGRTWSLIKGPQPRGYRSAAAYVPGTAKPTLVVVGPTGSDYSTDDGETWLPLGKIGFHAVGFAGPNAGWAVGEDGMIARSSRSIEPERR